MLRSISIVSTLCLAACLEACGPLVVIEGEDGDVHQEPSHEPSSGVCGPAGQPVVIASGLDGPGYIAVDTESLYFAESNVSADRLLRLSKTGGDPVTLAPAAGAYGIVVDETKVYWVTYDNIGSVRSVAKEGGPVEMLETTTPRGTDLAQDEASLYWLGTGSLLAGYADGVVMEMSKQGGAPVVLASEQRLLDQLALSDGLVYWTHRTAPVDEDPSTSVDAASELVSVAKGGGPATVLFQGQNVSGLATDDDYVYWTAATGGGIYPNGIWRAPHAGGEPELVAETSSTIWRIHIDGPCLYFIDHARSVQRLDKGGGEAAEIAKISSYGAWLATDASTVYVTEYQAGLVWAIDK
jgi:hypothetical protein